MTDAAIGSGTVFSLTSMAVVQCGTSMTTHMYMHRRYTRGIQEGGENESSLFGFVPSVSVAIPPPYGRRTIAPNGWNREKGARHSRPAEKIVLVASDINIFGTLPNCQGKLFVRPSDHPARAIGLFLVLVWAANRRYCGNDDDDGTSCSNSSRSSERCRSCSVSIQTVVLSKPSSVAEAVLPCPYKWCMFRRIVVCRFFQ